MNITRYFKKVTMLLLGILLVPSLAWAAVNIVIEDVQIAEDNGCAEVTVSFTLPVRYIRHFPLESGDDLRVQLEPIAAGPAQQEALNTRQKVEPPPSETIGLTDVIYEGDVEGGPYLTFYFSRKTTFKVAQGADFRSLVVMIGSVEAGCPDPAVEGKPDAAPERDGETAEGKKAEQGHSPVDDGDASDND